MSRHGLRPDLRDLGNRKLASEAKINDGYEEQKSIPSIQSQSPKSSEMKTHAGSVDIRISRNRISQSMSRTGTQQFALIKAGKVLHDPESIKSTMHLKPDEQLISHGLVQMPRSSHMVKRNRPFNFTQTSQLEKLKVDLANEVCTGEIQISESNRKAIKPELIPAETTEDEV